MQLEPKSLCFQERDAAKNTAAKVAAHDKAQLTIWMEAAEVAVMPPKLLTPGR